MQKFIHILVFLLFLIVTQQCEQSTEPDPDPQKSPLITETDYNNNLVGNIDPDDWILPHFYFSNTIQLISGELEHFYSPTVDSVVSRAIIIKNHSENAVSLSFSELQPPFYLNKPVLELKTGAVDSVIIRFILPEDFTEDYEQNLTVTNSKGESFSVRLWGISTSTLPIVYLPARITFGPAYPNPCDSLVMVESQLIKASHVKLQIVDSKSNPIICLYNEMHAAGQYWICWDLNDSSDVRIESGFYRFIYEVDSVEIAHGDIKVE